MGVSKGKVNIIGLKNVIWYIYYAVGCWRRFALSMSICFVFLHCMMTRLCECYRLCMTVVVSVMRMRNARNLEVGIEYEHREYSIE